MRVYLAGKISKNDWRSYLVPDLRSANVENLSKWPILKNGVVVNTSSGVIEYDYTGPFFVSCDHGCLHGPNQHGNGADDGFCGNVQGSSKELVVSLCKRAIDNSDIVFAWIDSQDCFGTIAELGYARGKNKKILIAGKQRFEDLWFVYEMADKVDFDKFSNPLISFFYLVVKSSKSKNYATYIRSEEWAAKANAAKKRAGYRCQVCNRSSKEVVLDAHHRTYERLGNELPSDITVLCRDCHELYETNKKRKAN